MNRLYCSRRAIPAYIQGIKNVLFVNGVKVGLLGDMPIYLCHKGLIRHIIQLAAPSLDQIAGFRVDEQKGGIADNRVFLLQIGAAAALGAVCAV